MKTAATKLSWRAEAKRSDDGMIEVAITACALMLLIVFSVSVLALLTKQSKGAEALSEATRNISRAIQSDQAPITPGQAAQIAQATLVAADVASANLQVQVTLDTACSTESVTVSLPSPALSWSTISYTTTQPYVLDPPCAKQ